MEKISIDIPSWDAGQVMQMGGRVKLPPHIMQRKAFGLLLGATLCTVRGLCEPNGYKLMLQQSYL